MKYTEPNMEILEWKKKDIIRTSDDELIVFPEGDDGSGSLGGF